MKCDKCGLDVDVCREYMTMHRDVAAQLASMTKHAAEAKLAWAVEGLEEIARLYEPQTVAHIKAKHTLRTLGVDPSKEQEK